VSLCQALETSTLLFCNQKENDFFYFNEKDLYVAHIIPPTLPLAEKKKNDK
jgi:hypothetical protein